jgi:two-component system, LytTR family, sensor kinase
MTFWELFKFDGKAKIERSDWRLVGIFWLFAGSFIISGYQRTTHDWGLAFVWFLFYAVPCTFISFFFVLYLVPRFLNRSSFIILLILLMLLLMAHYLMIYYHYIYIQKIEVKPLTFYKILMGAAGMGEGYGFFVALIMGKQFIVAQRRMLQAEKERNENELRMLRAQVDPHFLFNSLNTLNILIDINPNEARVFTEKLANLYRQLLQVKDEDLVSLKRELSFCEDYIYLLQQRFGQAYIFKINYLDIKPADTEGAFVPPAAVQLLIENAVKHNTGDPLSPIVLTIGISKTDVVAVNNKRAKLVVNSSGEGLKNLEKRYKLLTDKSIFIEDTEGVFKITLPLVQSV